MSRAYRQPPFEVPVVLILWNRPEPLRTVLDALRPVRPRTVFAVADGPLGDDPRSAADCAAARSVLDDIDWPCDLVKIESPTNLGCDVRVTSGLDEVFRRVPEAVVVEDDVVPCPAFFTWCAAMLARHRDDPAVVHVGGRNELGRWGAPGVDHLRVLRGGIWGWATWAEAWHSVDRSPATPAGAQVGAARLADLAATGLADPLLIAHLAMHLEAAATGTLQAWDVIWSLCRILSGGWSVIPPVNLVRNVGLGPGATRASLGG